MKSITLECIEDVVMIGLTRASDREKYGGKPAFIKGNTYRTYPYVLKDGFKSEQVIAAKNEMGERHILYVPSKPTLSGELPFYERHFKEVENDENIRTEQS